MGGSVTDASLIVVSTDRDTGIARMRLNRPEKRNAISQQMASEMFDAMEQLDGDDDVCVIVVEGTDGSFCAGADMTESQAAYERGERRFDPAAAATARVGASPKVTIAAIDGPVMGAGALLACACDLRVLSERARFRFPGNEYGLVVGAAGLTRLIGPTLAKELIFTSRVLEPEEASRIGLVNRVTTSAELEDTVLELAGQVAAGSPVAAAWAKQVIDAPPGQSAALETRADIALRGGPDHRGRFRVATRRVTGKAAGD
jgi:enoyl-CoA hydratase/carnithine racemase